MGKSKSKQKKLHSLQELKRGELQVYGKVFSATGSLRFNVDVQTLENPSVNRRLNVNLAGSSSKKYVKSGMYVLVQIWDFDKDKGTIIHTYEDGEVALLKSSHYWDYIDDTEEGEQGIIIGAENLEFVGERAPTSTNIDNWEIKKGDTNDNDNAIDIDVI